MSEALPAFLSLLDLSPAAEERDVRRSYAQRLKQIDPEADPHGFQALRDAYEAALRWVRGAHEEAPAPVAVQPAPRPDPSATAQDMLRALSQSLVAQPVVNLRMAEDRLHAALDDPRLLDLDARWMFEGGIAVLIAEGWQPGHEFLLPAAIDSFRWRVEHSRLQGFGRAGQIVDSAITELDLYELHAADLRLSLDKVARLLRDDSRPDAQFLMAHIQFAEHMAGAYPHLLHAVTNTQNIPRWRAWAAEALAAPREPVHAPKRGLARLIDRRPGLVLFGLLLLAFAALVFTVPKATDGRTPAPALPAAISKVPAGMPAVQSPAQYKTPPAVVYPAASRRLGETGRVLVRVLVRSDGTPGDVEPVNAWFIVPINFARDK